MLNLTDLNNTINQKQKEHEQELIKQFSTFRDQIEQGVQSIAEQGKRIGEITIATKNSIKTYEIEDLLKKEYYPISFTVTRNLTHNNPKESVCSHFAIEISIPSVQPNSTYGCSIEK